MRNKSTFERYPNTTLYLAKECLGFLSKHSEVDISDIIIPKFLEFRKASKIRQKDLQVYVLCGDREKRVRAEDLYRINWLRENGYAPYVMLFDKENIPRRHELIKLQRWVNNRFVFWKVPTFEEYKGSLKNGRLDGK